MACLRGAFYSAMDTLLTFPTLSRLGDRKNERIKKLSSTTEQLSLYFLLLANLPQIKKHGFNYKDYVN